MDDQRDYMVAMIAQNQQLLDVLKSADADAAAAPKKTKKRRAQRGPSTRLLLLAVLACALTFAMLWCCLAVRF